MHLRVRILTTQPASPSQTAIFAGRGFVNVIATRGTPRSQGRDHCDRLRVRVGAPHKIVCIQLLQTPNETDRI